MKKTDLMLEMISDEVKALPNVVFVLDSVITALDGNGVLSSVTVENLSDHRTSALDVRALFVCVGQIPSNEAFRGLVDIDESGYIIAGEDCRTNVPGIYAVGDCRTKAIRQLTTATADGAVAALA